jgi:hypothetical protein
MKSDPAYAGCYLRPRPFAPGEVDPAAILCVHCETDYVLGAQHVMNTSNRKAKWSFAAVLAAMLFASVIVAIILMFGLLAGCATGGRWNPASAAADAERDIASSRFRFAYVGGRAPFAPGLSRTDATYKILDQYGRLKIGPQGCNQDEHFEQRTEYARHYNLRMWSYVSNLK